MLARLVFVVLLVAALGRGAAVHGGAKEATVDCSKFPMPMCTRDYNPVCGTDGKTYSNECMMCLENQEQKLNINVAKRGPC